MSVVPVTTTETVGDLDIGCEAPREPRDRSRNVVWQPVALAGVLLLTVSINLWWVATYRRGLPYDIDESGYLQRAVRDANALHSGGLSSLWSTVRLHDPQAPLLTAVAGVFHWATGTSTLSMFAVQQLFYVVLVVATYLGSRRLMNRGWSLVAAVMVAGLPGVVMASRAFFFALPAAAMMTAALVAQLYSDSFRSRWLSILWGLFLGLSVLSRTVALALVPALIVPAFVAVALTGPRRRQLVNVGFGLGVALLVAGSWYTAAWHQVLQYLTGYGYGTEAGQYGSGHSVASLSWWTARLDLALNSEVLAAMTVAIVLCVVAGAASLRHRRRSESGQRTPGTAGAAVRRALRRPDATLWIFVAVGYIALSTSQNSGSMFELPLLPAVCILAASTASRCAPWARPTLAAACVVAAAVSFAGVSGRLMGLPPTSVVTSTGPVHLVAFDDRGTLLTYASSTGGGCQPNAPCDRGATMPGEAAFLAKWIGPSGRMASLLRSIAGAHACDPVVFFAVQDPLFNSNSVDLSYQLTYAKALPTGLFKAPRDVGESPLRELNDPGLGQPNLVITGPVSSFSPRFSPLVGDRAARHALKKDGFAPVAHLGLPDGRTMRVWWLDRGPCGPGRP